MTAICHFKWPVEWWTCQMNSSSICAWHGLLQCKVLHKTHFTNPKLARITSDRSDACNIIILFFFVLSGLMSVQHFITTCLCCRSQSGARCGWGQQEIHGAQWGTVWCSDWVSLAASRVLYRTGLYHIQSTRANLLLNLNMSSLDLTSPGYFIFSCLLKFWHYGLFL